MHPDVQAFKDALEAKRAVKAEVMVALGNAKYADYQAEIGDAHGEDTSKYRKQADEQWAIVEAKGMAGEEGRLFAEMQALADRFVAENPGLFTEYEHLVPDGLASIVTLTTAVRRAGFEEASLRLMMFELARFERQQIGGEVKAKARLVAGKP